MTSPYSPISSSKTVSGIEVKTEYLHESDRILLRDMKAKVDKNYIDGAKQAELLQSSGWVNFGNPSILTVVNGTVHFFDGTGDPVPSDQGKLIVDQDNQIIYDNADEVLWLKSNDGDAVITLN